MTPHTPDPAPLLRLGGPPAVRMDLVAAPQLRVTRLSVNGRQLSERSWQRVLARLQSDLVGQILVEDAAPLELPAGEDGALIAPFSWPTHSAEDLAGGSVTRREVVPGTWFEYARGGETIALETVAQDGVLQRTPVVEPHRVLVAVVSRDPESPGLLGRHRSLTRLDGLSILQSGSLIVIQADALAARATWFASRTRLEEYVLMHEFAHALGVPVDPQRTWQGPHSGAHCTRPECVLYPTLDWRSLLSGAINGWPLELCDACHGELAQARAAAASRASASSD